MVYYRKILWVLLSLSLSFIILMVGLLLWREISEEKQNYIRELDERINRIVEFSDSRFAMNQLRTVLVSSSDYLYFYVDKIAPVDYNRLLFSNYVKSLYAIVPGRQKQFAVSCLENDDAIMPDSNVSVEGMLKLFSMTSDDLKTIRNYFEETFNAVNYFLPVKDFTGNKHIVYVSCTKRWHSLPVYFFSLYTENQLFDIESIGQGQLTLYSGGKAVYTVSGGPAGVSPKKTRGNSRIIHSPMNNFSYELVYPPHSFFNMTIFLIILFGAAAAGLVILLTYRFTRKLYRPMEKLLQLTNQPVSQEDEFLFISRTIQDLHQEVDTMSASIEDYAKILERSFLRALLFNYVAPGQIEEKCREFQLDALGKPFRAVVIRYGMDMLSEEELSYNAGYVLKENLVRILTNAFRENTFFRIFDIAFDTQVIIASGIIPEKDISRILSRQDFKEQLNINAAIGKAVDRLGDIGISYRNALWLLEVQSYAARPQEVMTNKKINAMTLKRVLYYPLAVEQSLINAVIHHKVEQWQSILTDIIVENRERDKQNITQLSFLLTASVYRILDGLQKTPEEIFGKDIRVFLDIASCQKIEELYETMKFVLMQICKSNPRAEQKSNPFLMKQMEEIISKNYTKDMSLEDLSCAVGLSPNYVSAIFKQMFGRNFKDYLGHYRYEAACRIIEKNPEKKLKKVACECGCTPEILKRLFLKYGKILPTDFKKQVERRGGPLT